MTRGHAKYRHLSRSSSHRQALLRNLVTSLFKRESITTTWPKAKETQRLADKIVTLAKKNTVASRRRAEQIFYTPHEITPYVFSTIRERYATRPGGYTRVLRTEPRADDAAPTAILELVDGPRDMRFALTAQTVARDRMLRRGSTDITMKNKQKVTRYRENANTEFERLVQKFKALETSKKEGPRPVVYNVQRPERDWLHYQAGGKNRQKKERKMWTDSEAS